MRATDSIEAAFLIAELVDNQSDLLDRGVPPAVIKKHFDPLRTQLDAMPLDPAEWPADIRATFKQQCKTAHDRAVARL